MNEKPVSRFNEHDLQVLKADLRGPNSGFMRVSIAELNALLARLEAAERCAVLLARTGGELSPEVQDWKRIKGECKIVY